MPEQTAQGRRVLQSMPKIEQNWSVSNGTPWLASVVGVSSILRLPLLLVPKYQPSCRLQGSVLTVGMWVVTIVSTTPILLLKCPVFGNWPPQQSWSKCRFLGNLARAAALGQVFEPATTRQIFRKIDYATRMLREILSASQGASRAVGPAGCCNGFLLTLPPPRIFHR